MEYLRIGNAKAVDQEGPNAIYEHKGQFFIGLNTYFLNDTSLEGCIVCDTFDQAIEIRRHLRPSRTFEFIPIEECQMK